MKLRYLSINQLSQLTGRDRATISKRLETMKPYEENGRAKIYDTHEALPVLFAAESHKGIQKKIELVTHDIEKEKLHKIRMENDVRIGKLVDIEDVVKLVEKEYTFVKAQIKSLPSRLSKLLSMQSDPMVINELMTKEINEILNELITDSVYEKHCKEVEKLENEKRVTPITKSVACFKPPFLIPFKFNVIFPL